MEDNNNKYTTKNGSHFLYQFRILICHSHITYFISFENVSYVNVIRTLRV